MNTRLEQQFAESFGRSPDVIARAPGRIEFIGNHVDYNGGSVLGVAVDREVTVALSRSSDSILRIRSASKADTVTADVNRLARLDGADQWANYPLGVVHVLHESGLSMAEGFDLLIDSSIPEGAGMSSSAALELATAFALTAAYAREFPRIDLALLARRAENEFVGVPCGILDQGVSAFGQKDHLVHIDCRGPVFRTMPLPTGVSFWLFNTHSKHALVDSLYAQRHAECMSALERLRTFEPDAEYLTDISPATVEAHRADLPDALYRRALHVATEQQRVGETTEAVQRGDLAAVGSVLFDSHASSRDLFENSTRELDALVETLRDQQGVIGARLTGGGFGGAVVALTDHSFLEETAQRVADGYERRFKERPTVLQCESADGAQVLERRTPSRNG